MSNIINLVPMSSSSVKDALDAALEDVNKLDSIIIIGYEDDYLYVRSSNMDRKTALWMLEKARLHALDIGGE